jgi:hypothetical protein
MEAGGRSGTVARNAPALNWQLVAAMLRNQRQELEKGRRFP